MLRSFSDDDLQPVHDLIRRIETFDDYPLVTSFDELEENVGSSDSNPVVYERDGVLVGWGNLYYPPSTGRLARAYVEGGVDPDHRRQGIGRAILDRIVANGTEQMQDAPPGIPCFLRGEYYDTDRNRAALFDSAGFVPARWFIDMLLDLDTRQAYDGPPSGIQIEPWQAELVDQARTLRNAAFADHWGSSPLTDETFREVLTASNTELGLSCMAFDDATGELVAQLQSAVYPEDVAIHGRREGWIENIGTLAEHRQRGIASAMIRWACDAYAEAGLSHAALNVDSDSPTGADSLYTALGFAPMRRACTVELKVR